MMRTGFAALDKLTGGLPEGQGYLLYGNASEAKTALALAFLARGMESDEPVAMVTDRGVDVILEEGLRYGVDLAEGLRSGRFLLFEYPTDVLAATRQLRDDSRIIREFQSLVGEHKIHRLVLDPVTPLLSAPTAATAALRFQNLVSSFSGLGATAFYLVNSSDGSEYVPACREAAQGVLRMDVAGGSGTGSIVFERWPEEPAVEDLEFGVVAGIGLVPVVSRRTPPVPPPVAVRPDRVAMAIQFGRKINAAGAAPLMSDEADDRPRVLVIHPDGAQRSVIGGMLTKEYGVMEAQGAVDGLTAFEGQAPDVVVIAHELRGASGSALAHKIRQSGHNMPIILVGGRIRRLTDQAKCLHAGVDICLEHPVNEQILNLHIDNMLRRTGRLKETLNQDAEMPQQRKRSSLNCTTDLDYFCERAAEEYTYSLEHGLPVPVLMMRMPSGKPLIEELSSTALMVTRATDLVYVGNRGVAVLLPEARTPEPFLARFARSWTMGAPPVIDQPRLAPGDDVFARLRDFISGSTGTGFSVTQSGTKSLRGTAFGAVGSGSTL